jgi:glycosyltransferase involved in cell wall biosynthesis
MTPSVVAVMLTADRQEMAERAIRAFNRQDYQNKTLLVFDTGKTPFSFHSDLLYRDKFGDFEKRIIVDRGSLASAMPIGTLRNWANKETDAEIVIHWDDDDVSGPSRISDQVKLLVESRADVVGYREMLFWDVRRELSHNVDGDEFNDPANEAWLYRNTDREYCIPTSLCYWYRVWDAKWFPAEMIGSENNWQRGIKRVSVAAADCFGGVDPEQERIARNDHCLGIQPWSEERLHLVATIHGSNTNKKYIHESTTNADGTKYWTRVARWDRLVKEFLK